MDSKDYPRDDYKEKDPPKGKKKRKLKAIKKTKVKKKEIKNLISNPSLKEFNGLNKSEIVKDDKEKCKKDINSLITSRDKLKELMYNGANKQDVAKINKLAKEFLDKDDLDFIEVNYKELKKNPEYKDIKKSQVIIPTLLDKIEQIIETVQEEEAIAELEKEWPKYKEELENKLKEKEDEDMKLNDEEIDTAAKIFNLIKEEKKEGEAKEEDEKKEDEDHHMEEEGELNDEEMEAALKIIGNKERDLGVYDKKKFLKELTDSKAKVDQLLKNTVTLLNNNPKRIKVKFNSLNRENIINYLKADSFINVEEIANDYATFWANQKSASDGDLLNALMIKSLALSLADVKSSLSNINSSLTEKIKVDDKVQSKVIKGKTNVEIKKIYNKSYIPEDQWIKLDTVKKALKTVKDFDQFPRINVWKEWNEKQKITFFNERIKWNTARMRFLINLLQGKKDKENIYGFRTDINAAVALNNNVYYFERYSRGTFCPEIRSLWKKFDEKTRMDYNKMRDIAKIALEKLCQRGLFKGFVYRKNVSITLENQLFWKVDLDNIANEKIVKEKERFVYRKGALGGKPPTFLGKKKNRKEEKPLLEGEDFFSEGLNKGGFRE